MGSRVCSRSLLVICSAVLLASGCQALRVREEERPLNETVLMVSRGADEAMLSWQTRPGYRYIVLFADSRSAATKWKPLPGVEMLVGTGAAVTVKDAVPAGQPRFYRLEVIPPSGRKP